MRFAPRDSNTQSSVAALASPYNPKSDIQELKELLLDKIQSIDRHFDARIRGLARRNQGQRGEIPRQRTRDGQPLCFTCGRRGHFQASCPDRRNNAPRGPPPQQKRSQGVNYPPNYNYNQPRDNYRTYQQQNRRDQPLDALEEEYYDEHFVAELEQNVRDEQNFRPRSRSQPETFTGEQQTSVEIISKDSVFFCKQKTEVAEHLHFKGLTPSVPLLSPNNQDQSGTHCSQNGTTTRAPPSAPSPTTEITQERASTSVDAKEELKSFLASVLDLFKQLQDGNTQGPTEGSRTQAPPVLAQLKPDTVESNTITQSNAALLDNDTMNAVIKEVDPVPGCSLDSAQSLSGVEVSPTSVQSSSDPIQHEPSTDSLCRNQTTGSVDLVPCPTPIDSQALPETQLVVDNAHTLTRKNLTSHGPVLDNEREDVLHETEIPTFPAIRSPSTAEEPLSFLGVSTCTIIKKKSKLH